MPQSAALTSRLHALLETARVVRHEDDLRAVLSRVVAAVAELLQVRAVVLNLYRPAWDDFEVTEVHGSDEARAALLDTSSTSADWELLLAQRHRRCGVYFVAAGEIDWSERTPPAYVPASTPGDDDHAWDPEDALFAVLEASDGRTLGILSVDEPVSGRRPSDDELRVLHSVAAHAALAIEEAQSAARARRHRRALERLLAVSSEFGRQPNPARAMQIMCDAIREAFGFGRVTVTLSDDAGGLHRVAAAGISVFEEAALSSCEQLALFFDDRFARDGCFVLQPSDVEALLGDRPRYHSQLNGRGPHAWCDHTLLVPLEGREEELLGYLWVDDPADRLLPPSETLHALRTFANQAAMALEVAERIEALGASEARNAAVLEAALDAFVTIDFEGRILAFNPAAERMFGHDAPDAIGRDMASLLIPERLVDRHRRGFAEHLASGSKSMLGRRIESWMRHADGRELPVELALARTSTDGAVSYTAYIRDISERVEGQRRIAHLAYHDALTGLPNRAQLEEHLGHAVRADPQARESVALLYIDLDDFKLVNDSLGHAAGDELLRTVAERLTAVTREGDLLARHGGDEFLLLVRDLGSDPLAAAQAVAQKLIDALQTPFTIEGAELWVAASIGISLLNGDASCADDLLKNADAAMYQAKDAGRGRYAAYRTGTGDPRRKLSLSTRLRRALEREQFEMHYQPVIDVRSRETTGVEALLRWRDDDRLIPPGDFIPLAEETGLIEPIGEWVIRDVCRQAAAWRRHGFAPQMAFNLSPRQLLRHDLVETLGAAIRRHAIPADQLTAELTETALMRHAGRAQEVLFALHELGVQLAIDDFGVAYSSLTRLRDLPFDVLKIDRAFLADVPTDPAAAQIIEAMLSLARGLGLTAVAEGVEHEAQLTFLHERGCPLAQGFHLGRPGPAADVHGALPRAA